MAMETSFSTCRCSGLEDSTLEIGLLGLQFRTGNSSSSSSPSEAPTPKDQKTNQLITREKNYWTSLIPKLTLCHSIEELHSFHHVLAAPRKRKNEVVIKQVTPDEGILVTPISPKIRRF
jgi:hypothetical protein